MFSADAKDEVAAAVFECERCAGFFLRALAAFGRRPPRRTSAGLHAREPVLTLLIDRAAAARAALRAAKHAGIRVERDRARGSHLLRLPNAFASAELRLPSRACCRRAALRGAFLACGSAADPHRSYHLEFYCRADDTARALTDWLAALGVDTAVTRRRGHPVVYVKGASSVADVLGLAGAARAVLALDDLLALRQTKNMTRRRVNSEAANAARSAATAARQREAALRVSHGRRKESLTPALREAARLRIAHPDYTLSELAARARPAISKAAMAYRLREIERLSVG